MSLRSFRSSRTRAHSRFSFSMSCRRCTSTRACSSTTPARCLFIQARQRLTRPWTTLCRLLFLHASTGPSSRALSTRSLQRSSSARSRSSGSGTASTADL
eukprot:Amastigsp_a843013_16.p4 type:complete len:100 gc:universal Amastigsp_a843013_16:1053-754(-)